MNKTQQQTTNTKRPSGQGLLPGNKKHLIMNHEEYLQNVKELESEFENKKVELMKKFIRANNPYKVGDKVTDHIGSIIIEKIFYGLSLQGNKPCAIYSGLELKKNGTPTKKESRRQVWQSNVINK